MDIKILMAAQSGGSDPNKNLDLARILKEADCHKLPKENVDRALKKACDNALATFDEGVFEVSGHGGVGLVVCTLSDNLHRTNENIDTISKKYEANVSTTGSILSQFEQKGFFQPTGGYSPDLVLVAAIENDLDEIDFIPNINNTDEEEEPDTIMTAPELVTDLHDLMLSLNIPGTSGLVYLPQKLVSVPTSLKDINLALIDAFESNEDVDQVFHNMKV